MSVRGQHGVDKRKEFIVKEKDWIKEIKRSNSL
jgi:hypothetical protein